MTLDAGYYGYDMIFYRKMWELKLMPKLKTLDFTTMSMSSRYVGELREKLPDVSVNGYPPLEACNRYRQRFFVRVGHETTYAYVGNKHFFTK